MVDAAVDRLLKLVEDDRSVVDLRTYFDQGDGGQVPMFSGARFESLGGGGDIPEHRDRITPWDLVAVKCLSVDVPIDVSLDLLEGALGDQIAGFLEDVPADIDLGDDEARTHIEPGSPAQCAWHALVDQTDVGTVTAGKLLARKRPRLIPIWDTVVSCVYDVPKGNDEWVWLNDLLRERDGALSLKVAAVRDAAALDVNVSVLRTLDVILWMRHRHEHRRSRCPGLQ